MLGPFDTIKDPIKGVRVAILAHPEMKIMAGFEKCAKRSRRFYLFRDGPSFAKAVKNHTHRYFHEYAFPNRPVKVYFDLDDDENLPDWEDFVSRVSSTARELLNAPNEEIIRLNADCPEKQSAHLIFPEKWLDSPASLHSFVCDVKSRIDGDKRLDTQPYSSDPDVLKSIRAPWCTSYRRTNVLLPEGETALVFNEAVFLKCLVTHGVPSNVSTYSNPRLVIRAPHTLDTDPVKIKIMRRIEEWIKMFWNVKRVDVSAPLDVVSGGWVWTVHPGIWCPKKRRRHNSNGSMIRGRILHDRIVEIETFCFDIDCKKWIKHEMDWTAIGFPLL